MKNQTKPKGANDENELRNRVNIPALTMQNELFNPFGEDSFASQFNLDKIEEEILIHLVGKLTIPTKSLSPIPSLFKQS